MLRLILGTCNFDPGDTFTTSSKVSRTPSIAHSLLETLFVHVWRCAALRDKLEALSRRALGKPEEQDAGSAITDLAGDFYLRQGILHFRKLRFRVEGGVELARNCGLRQGELDFATNLALQAKVSQTVNGPKSFVLKAFDPFFGKKRARLCRSASRAREEILCLAFSVFHKSLAPKIAERRQHDALIAPAAFPY